MLALLFEFEPRPGQLPRYLDIAASLRPSLLQTEGFLYIDRFQSLSRPEVYLSHSLWRDEASIARWRSFEPHFYAQREARENILAGYRLRISTVLQVDRAWSPVYDQRPGKPRLGIQIQYEEADNRAIAAMAEHDEREAARSTPTSFRRTTPKQSRGSVCTAMPMSRCGPSVNSCSTRHSALRVVQDSAGAQAQCGH